MTVPLFDLSEEELSEAVTAQLQQNSQRLKNLREVFKSLIKNAPVSQHHLVVSAEGLAELETKLSVCRLVCQYSDVVFWFCNAGLLPEKGGGGMDSNNVEDGSNPYPAAALSAMYREKRRRMQDKMTSVAGHLEMHGLLIDGMCMELGEVLIVRARLHYTIVLSLVSNTMICRTTLSATAETASTRRPPCTPYSPST